MNSSESSYHYTYRSIKAIQSKIYQVKPDVEREALMLNKFSHYIQYDRNQLNEIDPTHTRCYDFKQNQLLEPTNMQKMG